MSKHHSVIDAHQNCWQLASIQIATIGIPGTIIGGQLAQEYGAGTALLSSCIGNLILWGIGLFIVLMSFRNRSNAIENVSDYLGRGGAYVASAILAIVFLAWYPINLTYSAIAIDSFSKEFKEHQILFNVLFGVIIAFISIGGIKLIKKICVLIFPLLLIILLYMFCVTKTQVIWAESWKISFPAIGYIVAVILSGIVNLPTFFRHSRSKAHSIFALSLMTFFVSLFQILTICIGIATPSDFFSKVMPSYGLLYPSCVLILIVSFSICVNLGNIYFASAILDVFLPFLKRLFGNWRYCLIGGIGTAIYIMPSIDFFAEVQKMAEGSIACLDVILMGVFLIKIFVKHRLRLYEKWSSGFCWLVGSIATIIVETGSSLKSHDSLLIGVGFTLLAFWSIVFIEETIWSARRL